MASLESRIDELYSGSLDDFVRERAVLAKTMKGADAQRVKRLQKPLLVPWVVNQVYWHARRVYERLEQAGERLRIAQVATLSGRDADVRGATRAHRDALSAAVDEGMRLASAAGARPGGDQLARTFEALSLASKHPAVPGRLTKPLTPAGFEALGGVAVKVEARKESHLSENAREREAALERRRHAALAKAQAAALRKAEGEVARARSAEASTREKWEQAKQILDRCERALKSLR